jgi:cytochrome c biogenesis protein CcdA
MKISKSKNYIIILTILLGLGMIIGFIIGFAYFYECYVCKGEIDLKAASLSHINWPIFLAVAEGGLAAGINPCSVAMMLMLLGYLAIFIEKPKKVLKIGTAYITTLFFVFLFLGLLFYQTLSLVVTRSNYQIIHSIFYILLGSFLIGWGILNLRNFITGRRHKVGEFKIKLLSSWMAQANIPKTIVLALLVSVFGLPCSLIIYAGIISIFPSALPLSMLIVYLLIFNLAFILPLIIILALIYSGTNIALLKEWQEQKTQTMKLLSSLALLIIGILIILTIFIY